MLRSLVEAREPFDVFVIGGGATGLGIALDAASRGYRTALCEQSDFAKGTSSRSTKLVHGGVRYLQQGQLPLVIEALEERGLMRRNAPHLVRDLAFIVPSYSWWEGPFYGMGLKIYDLLAGRYGFGRSTRLSTEETLRLLPNLEKDGLRGGTQYFDGQFDDARMALCLAQTAAAHGAVVVNYAEVAGFIKVGESIKQARIVDKESNLQYGVAARVFINATGPFSDAVCALDAPSEADRIRPSQGVHIVLDRSFLPGDAAIMVPRTEDGRVLFAIPWYDSVVVGTTDTEVAEATLEPCALPEEVEFLLENSARYFERRPTKQDIKSVFAGIRPLIGGRGNTARISREHSIEISDSGLVTIGGGKWTTYRKMAEDAVDAAAVIGELEAHPCKTRDLKLVGAEGPIESDPFRAVYGSAWQNIKKIVAENSEYGDRLIPNRPEICAQVIWAVRTEMARTVEDVLARRLRLLFFNVEAALKAAPKVAQLMAHELGRDSSWQKAELERFNELSARYYCPER